MLNRMNGRRELDRVDMLIRALSDEIAAQRTRKVGSHSSSALQHEMEEAVYELRLRKLLFSALVGSERGAHRVTRH
jgi:hypothetical protein